MEKILSCIEKNQAAEAVALLEEKLKNPSFNKDYMFRKRDPKYPAVWTHTLFSYACMHGCFGFCTYLESKKEDPRVSSLLIEKTFPLAISVLHNQFHIADWLQEKFDIDCSAHNSWPLAVSAVHGNLRGVKYALAHNADVNIDNGRALRWAIAHNHFGIAKLILDHGVDFKNHIDGRDLVETLVDQGQFQLAAKVVLCGADPSGLGPRQQRKLKEHLATLKMVRKRIL